MTDDEVRVFDAEEVLGFIETLENTYLRLDSVRHEILDLDPDEDSEHTISCLERVIEDASGYLRNLVVGQNTCRPPVDVLESRETQHVGQTEDLKLRQDEPALGVERRYWLSRMSKKDGETHAVRVEEVTSDGEIRNIDWYGEPKEEA